MLTRIEDLLVGPAPADVRRNMRIELGASMASGPYHAALLFVPVVMQRLGADAGMIALYLSASYIGFLMTPFAARVIPARGVQTYLAWISGSSRAIFMLLGAALTAPFMVAVSVVVFFLDSFPSPAYTRIIQLIYPARIRGRAMGYVRLGLAGGMLIYAPLCGWILDQFGYTWLFPLAGATGILAAWIFSHLRVNDMTPVRTHKRAMGDLWQVLRSDGRFRIYLLAVIAFGLGGLIPSGFYPAVIVDRLNLSYTDVSALATVQSICWLGGYLVWGHIMDRFNGVWTLRVLYLLMALVPLSYTWASSGWMLLPSFIAQGLGSAGIDLAFQNTILELAPEDRVYEYAALQRATIGIRGLIGPLLGVLLAQMGVAPLAIFIIGSSLYACAALLMLSGVFRARPKVM